MREQEETPFKESTMEKTAIKPTPPPKKRHLKRKSIPQELIYEMVDGNPIYYRDYKKVLTQKKSLEEMMGSRSLQTQSVIEDIVINVAELVKTAMEVEEA
jgi:hypothetical protein